MRWRGCWRIANLHKRSAEILLADLDSSIQDGYQEGLTTGATGLDIQGAFDTADLGRLAGALEDVRAPRILIRFIGN